MDVQRSQQACAVTCVAPPSAQLAQRAGPRTAIRDGSTVHGSCLELHLGSKPHVVGAVIFNSSALQQLSSTCPW